MIRTSQYKPPGAGVATHPEVGGKELRDGGVPVYLDGRKDDRHITELPVQRTIWSEIDLGVYLVWVRPRVGYQQIQERGS